MSEPRESYESVLAEATKAAITSEVEIAVLLYTDEDSLETRYGYAPPAYVRGLFGPDTKAVGIVSPKASSPGLLKQDAHDGKS